MKKRTRLIKRAISLLLVLLFSIISFAAIVSDNDGSAFITKAEFDSLKNDFQAQIDNYNTSIESKIDGAIAAYLAGIRLSQVSDLVTALGDYYELPLVNYKSTLQVKNELKECYVACDFAGFWNFSKEGGNVDYPTCFMCISDGNGHSGFYLNKKYEDEDTEYEITKIYKSMNLKFEDRFIHGGSYYRGMVEETQQYVHGAVGLSFGNQNAPAEVSDGWFWAAGDGAFRSPPSAWTIWSLLPLDTSNTSTLATVKSGTWGWSVRQGVEIYNKFKVIGTESKKFEFLISNADVKVPLIDNNTFTRNFHLGFHSDKWPKTSNDNWQKAIFNVMNKLNPDSSSSSKLVDFNTDLRYFFPTFLEKESGTFNELDTLQKCAKLYTYFKVNDKNTKVYPISGAILAVMPQDVQKLDFIFDFNKTTNNKKYHLLFKKNNAFTASDITNLESIEYQLNGKKATKTDYADYGEIKVSIDKLDKGDVLWMTWVTNDDNDGGTLNKIVSAKMTTE